jgi:UDP-N-acetylmuramoyl-tripeptide--D-alanyl-D-alanine ligase
LITLRFDIAAQMAGGTLVDPVKGNGTFSGVSIDSRTLQKGQLFVAIRGQRSDGHLFINQAIERGAAGVIVESHFPRIKNISEQLAVILVDNSHEAMIHLAARYRDMCHAKFIGITGSNGKTTTKEMTFSLLTAVEKDVYKSTGNLNNLFGLPLALFAMPISTKVAVLEMGISTPGEMIRLSSIVRPDIAVITSVSATHLEFLGSVEGVAKAKLELVTNSSKHIPLIINADSKVLFTEAKKIRKDIITFGVENQADFKAEQINLNQDGVTVIRIEGKSFHLPVFGQYQVYNFLAAYAVARTLGYCFNEIATEKMEFTTAPMRGQKVQLSGITFIVDCYNANPDSVHLGLQSFALLPHSQRRVVILGDMLELGDEAERYHRKIAQTLTNYNFDLVVFVGPLMKLAYQEAIQTGYPKEKLYQFDNASDCANDTDSLLKTSDLVYLKGSRGIGLEKVLEPFSKRGGTQ